MILFQKDFEEQGAFVDLNTKNTSFLKMALVLNKMGVRNNKFFLALTQKELVGIDPYHLPDDSIELKERIAYECKVNPWYFLREVVRITASGSGGIPYILNRSNLSQAWVFFNSINSMQVMPRQLGKTIGTAALQCMYLYIAGNFVNWGMFCKGNKLQYENVDRLKKIRDALPKWLIHPSPNDANNKEGIFYAALNNGLITFVSQSDKVAAGDQARGQSFAVESWDEIAYYNNIDLSYPSATAAMNTAGEQAKASGLPSAIILTTTAGDLDDPRGKWCYRTACDAVRFTEQFYDCHDRDELWQLVKSNSRNDFIYIEYNHKQLGKDQEWLEMVTRNKDEKTIAKDYLNQWLHGSDASLFGKELLEKIQTSRKDPVAVTSFHNMLTKWYDDPKVIQNDPILRNKPYVIGCDTSDNVGKDYTTVCMIDPCDLHIVCTVKCNMTNLYVVAKYMVNMLRDFPRSIFIPERNKNGAFLLDYIFAEMKRETFNPLTRIYNKFFQEYNSDTDIRNLNYESGLVRKMFGFSTTKGANSRELLYSSVLMTALKLVGDRLNDSSIIDEISGLTMKNGRVDHSDVGHDDLLIAFLLACYFVIFASNHQLYGIGIDEFMCNVRSDGEYIDADVKKNNALMRSRLIEYKKRYKQCKDTNPVAAAAYQREIQLLISAVGDVDIEEDSDAIKPIDQVTRNANDQVRQTSGVGLRAWLNVM